MRKAWLDPWASVATMQAAGWLNWYDSADVAAFLTATQEVVSHPHTMIDLRYGWLERNIGGYAFTSLIHSIEW
jgi:hypothetical protein